ncbi:MAG: lipid-A-disaccharide synthase [Alphaproteobacteria bacterium]|jgi:lipid-A-disaccharide synthase|nr:lipid-A-disaccharide synthase [Alphaproteobacteria bacterium]
MNASPAQSQPSTPLHAYVIAGEPSGDVIGARLITALRDSGKLTVSGIGGPEMEAAGIKSLFPYETLAIMGLTEVLPSVPRILRRMRQTARDIAACEPDVIITIDSPGFVFGVIRRLKSRTCPRVHYVAPTIWAWRAGRVKKFRKHFDHLLALFSFEPTLFEQAGFACTFVGHPIAEGAVARGDGVSFRDRHGIKTNERVFCLLPGSRRGEVERIGPIAADVVRRIHTKYPELRIVVPAAANVRVIVEKLCSDWAHRVLVVDGSVERYDAFAASDLALSTSGTVTLELAYAGVPTVVMYRIGRVTGGIVRHMIKVTYASIVNIVADKLIFPEFLQSRCRADLITPAVEDFLKYPEKARAIGDTARSIAADIAGSGDKPSVRAARAIRTIVDARRTG